MANQKKRASINSWPLFKILSNKTRNKHSMCQKNEKIDFKQFMVEAKKKRELKRIKNDVAGTDRRLQQQPILKCDVTNTEDCTCDRHFFIFGEPIL